MQRASVVNRQVQRLRTMRFVHRLADALNCHHTGYALEQHLGLCQASGVEVYSHKWGGRLSGAEIPAGERALLIARYPDLHDVWYDPLWDVLMDGGSSQEWREQFDAVVPYDHAMRNFSNRAMNVWVGVPEPQRLREMLILLRCEVHGLFLQRLWLMRNLAAYTLVVSVFDPFLPVATPLYRCIRDLPLDKASSANELRECLPIDPQRWGSWVKESQHEVEKWQSLGVG